MVVSHLSLEGTYRAAAGMWPDLVFVTVRGLFGSIATRGENGTDYFRSTDRPKAYGRQKRIRSDSYRIRSRIRLVINGNGKGYGFTIIRPYPKIYHISRLYLDNIRQKYPAMSY
jgi:hypothetical protein